MARPITIRLISVSSGALVTALIAFGAFSAKWSGVRLPTWDEPPIIQSDVLKKQEPPPAPPEPRRAEIRPIQTTPIRVTDVIDAPPAPYDGPDIVADAGADVLANGGAGDAAIPVITRPDWLQRPHDLGAYYPERARDRGREGEVVLDCLVGTDGRLGCSVASETPTGWGFGRAALAIARDHQMVPATRDGAPVTAQYRMRVPFALQE